ncbi:MAG: shikimate dehydrogenase [Duncaniella sp.]|nr:shikimate dehydrogenase [Duncaniella sp.]
MKKEYGIIGFPLGHSFSGRYFNEKFKAENIDAEYVNFELPDIGDLMELIAESPLLVGLNVTIPYKQQVIPYLTSLDNEAREVGAVNVIKIVRPQGPDGPVFLAGFNSDLEGFRESIRPLLGAAHERALILGTGGASKAVAYGLKTLGVEYVKVSRRPGDGVITYADLTPEVMESHKVIINATPVGTYPDTDVCPDIPYDLVTPGHLCFDLVYNPAETKFMRLCAERGATVKNGLEMLHLQAQGAWRIWNE